MLALLRSPDLAAEVTLQPIEEFDLDAAIIFSDILLPLDAAGLALDFVEGCGPVFRRPIRSPADVDAFRPPPPEDLVPETLEAIRRVRRALEGRAPLIGFSGAPLTLAFYAIEGGGSKTFAAARAFMRAEPAAWAGLMDRLAEMAGEYLAAQVRAGAQAIQVFDTWAGLLSADDYRRFALPWSAETIRRATAAGAPVIHFAGRSAGLLPCLREAGGDVISLGADVALDEAWAQLGFDVAVQGNLDPDLLLAPPPAMETAARDILRRAAGRPGHIFNLGHGVKKETDPTRVRDLVKLVHDGATCSEPKRRQTTVG